MPVIVNSKLSFSNGTKCIFAGSHIQTDEEELMKKIIISISAIAILAISGNVLFARGGMGFEGGNGIMQKELNLTADQQDKIFKISQDFRQKMYDNRKDTVKVAEIRVERLKAIIAVLTPEQKEKFNTLQQNRPERSKHSKKNCCM